MTGLFFTPISLVVIGFKAYCTSIWFCQRELLRLILFILCQFRDFSALDALLSARYIHVGVTVVLGLRLCFSSFKVH